MSRFEQVNLLDEDGNVVGVQTPLSVDGDSVYIKDIDVSRSVTTNWTSVNGGTMVDLFGDLIKGITYTGSDNPKTLTIAFHRAIITTGGMGILTTTGNFSNVKLIAVQGDGTETTLVDFSSDNTDRTLLPLQFSPTGFTSIKVEFHTADDVTLTNFVVPKAVTTISRIQGENAIDGAIETVITYRQALQVDTALVHRVGISEHAKLVAGGSTTLDVEASAGDTTINVTATTGFIAGDLVCINGTAIHERSHFHILTVNAGVSLELNRPLDNDHPVGSAVDEVAIAMNVVGSLGSPVSFKVEPPSNERWQITRILPTMLDDSAMDDGKFGGLNELTNGVVIRIHVDGEDQTLTHWKSNADLKDDMYDVEYSPKAPAGQHGLSGRWTFTKAEFVADLNGANGDYLEVLIQDDLSGLLDYETKAQGRLFGG